MIKKYIALLITILFVVCIMCSCGGKREVKIYNKTEAIINEVIVDAEDGPTTDMQNLSDNDEITVKLSDKFEGHDTVTVLLVTNHDEEYSKIVKLNEKGETEVTIKEEDYQPGNPLEELRRKANKFFNND